MVAAFFGLWAMLEFDAPILALLSAATFPVFAGWVAGLHDRKQLAKIAVYAALGWALTFMLQPVTVQYPSSRASRIAESPLVRCEWQIPASAVSSLLVMVGVGFVPASCLNQPNGDSDVAS
jgi:hypothetical protein